MSEQVYTVSGHTKAEYEESESVEWTDYRIQFSEMDDDTACLCTFPHNFTDGIDAQHVRSLALLGAAVVLAHQGELEEEYNFLPNCVPQWIRDEIAKRIPGAE